MLGHRRNLNHPRKELAQLQTLQEALENAGKAKVDPKAVARVAELQKRAMDVDQRQTMLKSGIDYSSRGMECLQLLKEKGYEMPNLDVLLDRLQSSTTMHIKLTGQTR